MCMVIVEGKSQCVLFQRSGDIVSLAYTGSEY